jgi:Plus-3 domain
MESLSIAFAKLLVRLDPISLLDDEFKRGQALSDSKNYKINNQTVNQQFSLKHGSSVKDFPMDRASNSLFVQVGVFAEPPSFLY